MEESPRILGVDDSLTIRKALELVLRPAGYNLQLAASGMEAIEKAKGFLPAVLLLDFILPDMRGTEVCRMLAADPETANIPVVLISAKGAEIRQAYQDVGNVVSYITKPFTPEDVTGVVADVLARVKEGGLIKVDQQSASGISAPVATPPIPTPQPTVVSVPPPPSVVTAPPESVAPIVPQVAPVVPPSISEPRSEPGQTPFPVPVAPVTVVPMAAEVEVEPEDVIEEIAASGRTPVGSDASRRDAMEAVLEALRSGLEGVYVEEADTTTGAAADESKTYTDLVSQLTGQLGETLIQARSGARYTLSNDGSVRSLQDMLFDAYRRVCRLFFRAVGTEAVDDEQQASRARIMVACRRDGELHDTLRFMLEDAPNWHSFLLTHRFRQLPMMIRLFGPSYLVVEAGRGALWDQMKLVRDLPEGRRLKIIAIVRSDSEFTKESAALTELGIDSVLQDGPDLIDEVRGVIAARSASRGSAAVDKPAP